MGIQERLRRIGEGYNEAMERLERRSPSEFTRFRTVCGAGNVENEDGMRVVRLIPPGTWDGGTGDFELMTSEKIQELGIEGMGHGETRTVIEGTLTGQFYPVEKQPI